MKQLTLLTAFWVLSVFCVAQTTVDTARAAGLFPGTVRDSGLQVTTYTHTVTHGPCFKHAIDSVTGTDSTIRFRLYVNTDVCQTTTFSFVLDVDSAGILRVTMEPFSPDNRICQGVNCNAFVIECRKTVAPAPAIKGVCFMNETACVPAQGKRTKKR